MNLLYTNDKHGEYPNSWYAATAKPLSPYPALCETVAADVCIIGAGFTGISTALHLAELGYSVTVLEAQRVGFGASGRNGGQLGMGQRMDQDDLIDLMGDDAAHMLWDMALDAQALVKSLIQRFKIDCELTPGVANFGHTPRLGDQMREYADFLNQTYGATHVQPLSVEEGRKLCNTKAYHGGFIDWNSAHLHPLKYVLGLTNAAQQLGVQIYEQSLVTQVKHQQSKVKVITKTGAVTCDHVVYACNGYLGDLEPNLAARIMPINNFIVATEPLSTDLDVIPSDNIAIADSKFVVNYFRKSADNRLLFGGGENYGYQFPKDIAATVRKPMTDIFPQLRDVTIDYAWGGTLGITIQRMPYFARPTINSWAATGYSGHGVGTATHAGQLIAQAIHGDSTGFDIMASVPSQRFPGGTLLRSPLLVLAMTWYGLRDKLGI